jgi:hypothetical protein
VALTHEVFGSIPNGGTTCGLRNAQGGIPAAPLHLPLECDGLGTPVFETVRLGSNPSRGTMYVVLGTLSAIGFGLATYTAYYTGARALSAVFALVTLFFVVVTILHL